MALVRRLYSSAPAAESAQDNHPTLLVSWWCTGFALAIILVRLSSRYVRTEKLFREDKVMFWSIAPLLLRMGMVHVVLLWGTNNAITTALSATEIKHREIGSKVVLAARITYAAYLWIAKWTILEFLKRMTLTSQIWRRSYEIVLQTIRWFLIVTYVAVVIATLAECQPFENYWKIVPDPGPKCRQGYTQLIMMGAADTITDLVLVGFPVSIVLTSSMPRRRKLSLTFLFALSLILVGITLYRVTATIERHSAQRFRSLLASLEILAAAAVSNALVLGSFIRDRGVKKARFRLGEGNRLDNGTTSRRGTRIANHSWGSDADLVGDLGIMLSPEFSGKGQSLPRPAPVALSYRYETPHRPASMNADDMTNADRDSGDTDETDLKASTRDLGRCDYRNTTADVQSPPLSFFDVGGLLDASPPKQHRPSSTPVIPKSVESPSLGPSRRKTSKPTPGDLQDVGGLLSLHEPSGSPYHTEYSAIVYASSPEYGVEESSLRRGTEDFLSACELNTNSSSFRAANSQSPSPYQPRNFSRPSTSPGPPNERPAISP